MTEPDYEPKHRADVETDSLIPWIMTSLMILACAILILIAIGWALFEAI